MLKNLFFIISLFYSSFIFAYSGTYFEFLKIPQNPENPGFCVYSSSVNSFIYNPSVRNSKKISFSAGYNAYPFDFYSFNFNTLLKLKQTGNLGLSIFYFYSSEIPIYDINDFYDPINAGDVIKPNSSYILFSLSPYKKLFFYLPLNYGLSIKFIRENLGDVVLYGSSFDFGLNTYIFNFCKVGFAINNIAFIFYKTYFSPPIKFSLGVNKIFKITKNNFFAFSFNNSYLLGENFVVNAEIKYIMKSKDFMTFGPILRYRYSIYSTYYDGLSFGVELGRNKNFNIKMLYILDYKYNQFLHNFSLRIGM